MKISDDLIKNDVPAEGQLADDDCIRFTCAENADLRVLFIGNSITRHGVAEHIGWHGDYGVYGERLRSQDCRETRSGRS